MKAFENIVEKRENASIPMMFFTLASTYQSITRAVTKCDSILPPALGQKLLFCRQDKYTDECTDGHTDRLIPV